MKSDVAVVASSQPNTVVFSGTHTECVKFTSVNSWLYKDMLILRYVSVDGRLGNGLRPLLWDGKTK